MISFINKVRIVCILISVSNLQLFLSVNPAHAAGEIYGLTVCQWSASNPRHDHQLIFPLKDGSLMFVWSEYYVRNPLSVFRSPYGEEGGAHDNMPCRISAKISKDAGRTWSQNFILQENLWKRNVKHPNLLRLPSGEIMFFFVGWDSNSQRNVFMKRSQNECESWSEMVRIFEPGWYCNNHDHVMRLSTGRIILPAHGAFNEGRVGVPYEGGKSKLHSLVYYSDDDGKTWGKSRNTMTAPGRGAHEPSIVELKDGSLLCFLRTTTGRIYKSYSLNRGETWSKPEPTVLKSPDCEPVIKRIPATGDILLLWNNVESTSNWPRTPLTAAISKDEGETWVKFKDIDARPNHDAAYPAVTFVGDEALVTYYSRSIDWARDSEVKLKIYPIKWFYE